MMIQDLEIFLLCGNISCILKKIEIFSSPAILLYIHLFVITSISYALLKFLNLICSRNGASNQAQLSTVQE